MPKRKAKSDAKQDKRRKQKQPKDVASHPDDGKRSASQKVLALVEERFPELADHVKTLPIDDVATEDQLALWFSIAKENEGLHSDNLKSFFDQGHELFADALKELRAEAEKERKAADGGGQVTKFLRQYQPAFLVSGLQAASMVADSRPIVELIACQLIVASDDVPVKHMAGAWLQIQNMCSRPQLRRDANYHVNEILKHLDLVLCSVTAQYPKVAEVILACSKNFSSIEGLRRCFSLVQTLLHTTLLSQE